MLSSVLNNIRLFLLSLTIRDPKCSKLQSVLQEYQYQHTHLSNRCNLYNKNHNSRLLTARYMGHVSSVFYSFHILVFARVIAYISNTDTEHTDTVCLMHSTKD